MAKDEKIKIGFAGTPEIAFAHFNHLLNSSDIDISFVLTQPNKKSGRGLEESKTLFNDIDKNIPILQPENLNDQDTISTISKMKIDLLVVVAYGKILPDWVLEYPKFGCLNIHFSLLPKWRGAAPIQHALLNQEDSTGVSTFLIEPKVDTGKIIDQLKIVITKDDNYGSLSKKLSEAGADLIESSINKCLHHSSELTEQDSSMATLAPKISKGDLKINWNDKSDTILAKVRAFSPTPGAFTTINSKRLKIFKAESINNDNNHEIGSIYHVDKNFFDVQCCLLYTSPSPRDS